MIFNAIYLNNFIRYDQISEELSSLREKQVASLGGEDATIWFLSWKYTSNLRNP